MVYFICIIVLWHQIRLFLASRVLKAFIHVLKLIIDGRYLYYALWL